MLSIFSWFGYRELPPAESLRLIRQAGFEGVLLWWDTIEGVDYRDMPALARREGLWVENIHAPFDSGNALWEDSAAGQTILELYLRCVDDCAAFEIPTMVIHPAMTQPAPPMNPIGIERFKRIAERAERRNVNVAVENMRGAQAIARGEWVLEQIDSPRLGFCYDNGHHHARHAPEADTLSKFGHRLMSLHLHDNDGTDDQHLLLFDGTVDWQEQMKAIAATGYQEPTTLEVMNEGYAHLPPAAFLAIAYERAKRLEGLRKHPQSPEATAPSKELGA